MPVLKLAGEHVRVIPRKRRSIDFKCRILDELVWMEENGIAFPQKILVSLHPSISAKNISDWSRDRDRLFRTQADTRSVRQEKALRTGTWVWFPDAEDRLKMNHISTGEPNTKRLKHTTTGSWTKCAKSSKNCNLRAGRVSVLSRLIGCLQDTLPNFFSRPHEQERSSAQSTRVPVIRFCHWRDGRSPEQQSPEMPHMADSVHTNISHALESAALVCLWRFCAA